jgi:phage I-like protein
MTTRLAALSLSIPGSGADDVPDAIQLTPAGPVFRATDGSGRPHDVRGWRIDARLAAALKARIDRRANLTVIDYEHQTLAAAENGQPAPAAGWFRDLAWRDGEGLFAVGVEWTARAAAMLRAGEYKYISPVFEYDAKSGDVLDVRMAALTNNPGVDGMRAVLRAVAGATDDEEDMNLDEIRKTLGLPAEADENAVLAAVAALKARAEAADGEVAALKARAEAADARAAALTAQDKVPLAVVTELQGQVVALTARLNAGETTRIVDEAKAAGKLVSGELEKHLRGMTDAVQLRALIEALPAVEALRGTQTGGRTPDGANGGTPGNAALAVMKALGITTEQYAKGKE